MAAALRIVPALSDDPRLIAWVTQAAEGFAHDVARVRRDIDSGNSHGFFTLVNGVMMGGVVLAEDDGYLVVEAAAGLSGFNLLTDFMPLIEQASLECGGRGVRFETYRRGMVEVLGRMGFETQFITMAKTFA